MSRGKGKKKKEEKGRRKEERRKNGLYLISLLDRSIAPSHSSGLCHSFMSPLPMFTHGSSSLLLSSPRETRREGRGIETAIFGIKKMYKRRISLHYFPIPNPILFRL